MLASSTEKRLPKFQGFLSAPAVGHLLIGLLHPFASRCASSERLRSMRDCGRAEFEGQEHLK